MTSLRWDAVTVDCTDAPALAAFWAALLDVEVRGTWQQYVGLHPPAGGGPRLVFQQLPGGRDPGPNSLHLDLHLPDRAALPAAVARAEALGARRVRTQDEAEMTWVVLADPEGNLFCLVPDG